jgi:hypothetical protein
MDEISKEQLAAIRRLSDEQLVKFITEVAQYSFAKAAETLRMMEKEKAS